MQLTVTRLRGVYAMLLQWPPFSRWKLPAADAVKFEVVGLPKTWADYVQLDNGRHRIRFCKEKHWTLEMVVRTMAHEMGHLRQQLIGKLTEENDGHNRAFERIEKIICSNLLFDPERF